VGEAFSSSHRQPASKARASWQGGLDGGTTLQARVDYYPDSGEVLLMESWRNAATRGGGTGKDNEIGGPTHHAAMRTPSAPPWTPGPQRHSNRPAASWPWPLRVASLIDIDSGFTSRAPRRPRIEEVAAYMSTEPTDSSLRPILRVGHGGGAALAPLTEQRGRATPGIPERWKG
jgi:hypothetical protein